MSGNKQAYEAAYQRAVEGKSSLTLWGWFASSFEDQYTRQSREKGERDGTAARAAAGEGSEAPRTTR